MFVRFRQTAHRLQVSIVETRRVDGKVRHEHVASLGSIADPTDARDRLAFWLKLHERLASLSNRVDAAMQAIIFGKVHERIPMVLPDEQRALQLENAKADDRFWSTFQDLGEDQAVAMKAMAAKAARDAATAQENATAAAARAAEAKARIAKLENGEAVQGGLGAPVDADIIARQAGWTESDIQHAVRVAELGNLGLFDDYLDATVKATSGAERRTEKRIARRMLREACNHGKAS